MKKPEYTKEELELLEKYGRKMDEHFENEIVAFSNGKRIDKLDLAQSRMEWEKRKKDSDYRYSYDMNCKWRCR